ncbi:plasma-membrane choline transporter-domain-containing protein [Cantharellus anzutake]|uniref:plasma-membrane choline transporter-domain-containing protein n=1 Tax=Cantharellus anzutake TaxID=1750568 RepID=UPI001906E131|nr:plasma-membrane choline transporter-domain-containing protein [Cantharellus anzutake]KAF8329838.1 plasma-membrane choline transporter-domain-containing protein [Cantharellus anzutake]
MQSPFSVYASAFLNRASTAIDPASSTSSHPLFYSATGGSDFEEDGSPFRRDSGDDTPGNRSLLDEEDGLPRLAGDDAKLSATLFDAGEEVSPYLDESQINLNPRAPPEQNLSLSMSHIPYRDEADDLPVDLDSLPMMDSDVANSLLKPPRSNAPAQGWRTHDSVLQPSLISRSPSIALRPDTPSDSSSISDAPPSYLLESPHSPPPPIPSTRIELSAQLTESLLPRDGIGRALFHLPDPDRPISKSKYNDITWMTTWLWAVTACVVGCLISLVFTKSNPKPSGPGPAMPLPYSTLTHTIPLLTMLVLASSGLSYGFLILFRLAVRPMLVLAALSTPLFLFLSAAYAFSGSFFYKPGVEPTWGETVGLRLFSLIPLGFAYLTGKSFYSRYDILLHTASVVELSTSLLISHPSVLLLSLATLFLSLVASLPFISLTLRLLLLGYFGKSAPESPWVWHVYNYAGTLAILVVSIWLWSWGVSRGIMRVVVGGVVGHWYFTAQDPAYTVMSQQQATRAALARAAGPSLGSVCAGAFTLNAIRASLSVLRWMRRFTTPPQLLFLLPLHPLSFVANFISVLDSLSSYTLVYIGITGRPFWLSARETRGFVVNTDSEEANEEEPTSSRRRRRGRGHRISDYTLVHRGYIFAAHTLSGPINAPLAALTCAIVTFLTVRFGLCLSEDAADAMFLCYHIDLQAGAKHRVDVFEAFEGRPRRGPMAV